MSDEIRDGVRMGGEREAGRVGRMRVRVRGRDGGKREVGMREIEREGWYSRSEMIDVHSERVHVCLTPFCLERCE